MQIGLKTFLALILLFEFGLIGVFAAVDLFVFYVFWEVALIPMYLMVGGWGGAKRMYASVKFFVITFLGSVMMLVGIIYLYTRAGTFDYAQILTALNSGRLILFERRTTLPVPGLLLRLCDQGAHLPAAHLAAADLLRGARARNISAGGRHVENGNLRSAALLPAAISECRASMRMLDCRAGDHRHRLRRARSRSFSRISNA